MDKNKLLYCLKSIIKTLCGVRCNLYSVGCNIQCIALIAYTLCAAVCFQCDEWGDISKARYDYLLDAEFHQFHSKGSSLLCNLLVKIASVDDKRLLWYCYFSCTHCNLFGDGGEVQFLVGFCDCREYNA